MVIKKSNKRHLTKMGGIICLGIILLIFLSNYYIKNYSSLIKNIEHNSKFVSIHYIDGDKKLVLFSNGSSETDKDRQYILTRYTEYGNFFYKSKDDNTGTVFYDTEVGVMASYIPSIGDVVWGMLNTKELPKRIEIQCTNSKENTVYKLDAPINNNTFTIIAEEASIKPNFFYGGWRYNVKVYDGNGNVISKRDDINGFYEISDVK